MSDDNQPRPAPNLRDLPKDSRGFLVPAETPWEDDGPKLSKVEPVLKLLLAAYRACAVCGYPMPRDEPVWRIFDDSTRKTTHEEIVEDRVIDLHVPGHLICMLYSALVCPYWRTAGGRLGRDTMFQPGSARGAAPAIMGFTDFSLLIDPEQPVGGRDTGQDLFTMLRGFEQEIEFTNPLVDLAPMYERARKALGGRYTRGKRRHYAPQLGGRKRISKEGAAVMQALNDQDPEDVVQLDGTIRNVYVAGWM